MHHCAAVSVHRILAVAGSLLVGASAALAWSPLPGLTQAQIERCEDLESDAMSAARGGDNAKAARLMAKATRIHDGNDGLWYNLACTQALAGQNEAAIASLRRASATGWTDANWPTKDTDLASLSELPGFQAWIEALAAAEEIEESWPKTTVAPATTAEELEERAEARQEEIGAYRKVLGGKDYGKLRRELTAWKASSWDAIADAETDPEASAAAKLEAIQLIAGKRPVYISPMSAGEILRRTAEFKRDHAGTEAMATVLTREAQASYARNRRTEDEAAQEAAERTFERDLLMVTSTYADGEGVEDALVHLVDLNGGDDRASATRLYARLKQIGDEEDVRKKMLMTARGAYYRIEGMPEFSATTTAGQPIGRADLAGSVTLVDFWATWCGPCKVELPFIKETYEQYHAQGFEILGVSLDNADDLDEAGFTAWCEKEGMVWQQIYDGKGWESELAVHFGVKSIPFALLLDRDGKVVAAGDEVRGEVLAEKVGELIGQGTQQAAR